MDSFDIYIPNPAATAGLGIDPASAIVGSPANQWLEGRQARVEQRESRVIDPADDRRLILDFEGNRYRASNIVTFADRCVHAAGRHKQHYPTVARIMVKAEEVVRVGSFDLEREEVEVDVEHFKALCSWTGLDAAGLFPELRGTSIRAQR
jgi:hypothetical protein